MRKDDILKLRERVLRGIAAGLARKHVPAPEPDARLYPQEISGENLWVDRLSYPDAWPHTGHGSASLPLPGLRYEVWYFQKRDSVLLALLCENRPVLDGLVAVMEPLFTEFVKDGRYARRYRPVSDRSPEAELLLQVVPGSIGIWRSAPLSEEKLAKALETLILDTYAPVQKALLAADPDGSLPRQYQEAVEERDPLAELRARFNRRDSG
ncbi:MAG: hypothetical protein KY468_17555 [Armatimonadetes bacterium]|nr:hypothetical protein [Armatimonadota bacterium]